MILDLLELRSLRDGELAKERRSLVSVEEFQKLILSRMQLQREPSSAAGFVELIDRIAGNRYVIEVERLVCR